MADGVSKIQDFSQSLFSRVLRYDINFDLNPLLYGFSAEFERNIFDLRERFPQGFIGDQRMFEQLGKAVAPFGVGQCL